MRAYSTGFAETYDPNFYSSATLTWTDLNGDDIAQGTCADVLRLPDAGLRNRFLDAAGDLRRQAAPGLRPTDIARPYQIETNVSVQREIMPGTSVTFSYFRRDYKNLIWSDNLRDRPSDYTLFNVPNPLNNGETVPIYNLNPAKASAVNLLDQNSSSQLPEVHRLRRQLQQPDEAG